MGIRRIAYPLLSSPRPSDLPMYLKSPLEDKLITSASASGGKNLRQAYRTCAPGRWRPRDLQGYRLKLTMTPCLPRGRMVVWLSAGGVYYRTLAYVRKYLLDYDASGRIPFAQASPGPLAADEQARALSRGADGPCKLLAARWHLRPSTRLLMNNPIMGLPTTWFGLHTHFDPWWARISIQ